jgi:hypothetical protein
MTARKCDLCKEAAFVPLPGWDTDQIPGDWQRVALLDHREVRPDYRRSDMILTICPFCVAVARALQAADVELAKIERAVKPAEADNKGLPHPFKAGGFGIADRPCIQCGLPDRDPIHSLDKNIQQFTADHS